MPSAIPKFGNNFINFVHPMSTFCRLCMPDIHDSRRSGTNWRQFDACWFVGLQRKRHLHGECDKQQSGWYHIHSLWRIGHRPTGKSANQIREKRSFQFMLGPPLPDSIHTDWLTLFPTSPSAILSQICCYVASRFGKSFHRFLCLPHAFNKRSHTDFCFVLHCFFTAFVRKRLNTTYFL